MFVQPEINLEDLNDIEALQDGTGENADEDTHSALPAVDNTKTGSDDNETKSAPENFEFAKDGIHGIESDIPGKLLDKITRKQLVYRKLKNRNTESHISKRSMVNLGNPVAFHAVISRDVVEHLGINQNIVFDTVQENYGNGYHSQQGLFIAPKSGLYLFSVSVLSYKGNVNPEFDAAIMKNGNSLAIAYGHADSGRYDQGSVTVVTHLNAGDEISVKNIDIDDVTIWGGKFTTFMGFLLTEM